MIKKILLVLISLIPLLIGVGVESFMINKDIVGFPLFLVGVLVFVGWFIYGVIIYGMGMNRVEAFVFGNLFGLFSLILILIQSLILGRFIDGYLGLFSQYYSMPIVRVIAEVDFLNTIKAAHILMIISHICLLGIFIIGFNVAEKRQFKFSN